jgi:hypothetical protein
MAVLYYVCFYIMNASVIFCLFLYYELLTCLTPPHLCTCSKSGLGVPTSYVVVFLCSVCSLKMRGDCYVNIDGIDDHIRLSFFFHCNKMYYVCFYIMNDSVIFCLFLYYEWQCTILFVFHFITMKKKA